MPCAVAAHSYSKIVAIKDALRKIPGVGWSMQCLRYLFLRRNWDDDKDSMAKTIRTVAKDGPMTILIFAEAGFPFSPDRSAA
jgi:1-acyl-sn-glycerol-3-phosphate acyltransferase